MLSDRVRAILDGANPAVLTTLNKDGSPDSSPVWVIRERDDVLISTVATRRKVLNIEGDPRVSIVVIDRDVPQSYVSINGLARISVDTDRALLGRAAEKYLGAPYPRVESEDVLRVAIRITPKHVSGQ